MIKRTLSYALAAVLGGAIVRPAAAQDMFPDTPDNHWAYEALLALKKDGLLVGYPDGLFRGSRPTSRYELAVATHAAYARLKALTSGLDGQIKALDAALDGKADKANLDELRTALAGIKNDVASMKTWGDEIGKLKKLADTFKQEIASLGVDIEAMKKDIDDLRGRIERLEAKKPPIDIHGTLDLAGIGTYGVDRYGIGVDGRQLGVGRGSYAGQAVGITRDLSILHEAALDFRSTNDKGVKWRAQMVVGNALDFPTGLGNQSQTMEGSPFREGGESVYFQDFEIDFDAAISRQVFNFRVGRIGYQISPYILQRPDPSPYFSNERWASGDWLFDGALMVTPIGCATFELVAGRVGGGSAAGSDGTGLQPMIVGKGSVPIYFDGSDRPRGDVTSGDLNLPISQALGAHLSVPVGKNVVANFSYLWLESNTDRTVNLSGVNRMNVYGGDVAAKFGSATIKAGYAQSDLARGMTNIVTKDNSALWVKADYDAGKWGASAGYRRILPLFGAPGEWGRIGIWWNPTDIEGWELAGRVDLTSKLRLTASGEFYEGTNNGALDGVTPDQLGFGSQDKVNRYVIGVEYKCSPAWTVSLGYETVLWNLKARANPVFAGGKPVEQWLNIGLGYAMNTATKLSVLWQVGNYDSKGVPGFGPFAGSVGDPRKASGGLVTTQLSVKF